MIAQLHKILCSHIFDHLERHRESIKREEKNSLHRKARKTEHRERKDDDD